MARRGKVEGKESDGKSPERIILDVADFNNTLEAIKHVSPTDLEDELVPLGDEEDPRNQRHGSIVFYGQFFMAVLSLILKLGPKYNEGTEPAPDEEATLENLAFIAMQLTPELFQSAEISEELTLGQILKVFIDAGVLKDPSLTFFDFASYFHYISSNNKAMTVGELFEWAHTAPKEIPPETSVKKREAGTDPFGPIVRFTNDNIHHATISALARASEWTDGDDYFKGLEQEFANLKISVSLPSGEHSASLWEFLCKGGAATVKAHYALWARYYEQVPDGLAMHDVVVNVNDFCRDLGYRKNKGAYKPDAKRKAMELLEALTTTELTATYQVPGTKKGQTKQRRLRGPIWRRGLEAAERDTYEDLFGQTRTGDPGQWIPCSFSYSPGPWHADKEWRRYNRYVGKIGAGLMQLDVRHDQWAILIGGYLGTLSRTGRYGNRRLRVSTILRNTGLDKSIGHRRSQFREKFYRALDRLTENGIIKSYKTDGFDTQDVDMEDPEALAEYGSKDPFPEGDWRNQIIEIEFDFFDDRKRLENRKTTALKRKKPRTTPLPGV